MFRGIRGLSDQDLTDYALASDALVLIFKALGIENRWSANQGMNQSELAGSGKLRSHLKGDWIFARPRLKLVAVAILCACALAEVVWSALRPLLGRSWVALKSRGCMSVSARLVHSIPFAGIKGLLAKMAFWLSPSMWRDYRSMWTWRGSSKKGGNRFPPFGLMRRLL